MKSWKILLQRGILLSQTLQKQREMGLAQNVLYHSVFTAFVLETDLLEEVKMDVFISSFVTNLQSFWWLVFKSSCSEWKLGINTAMILIAWGEKKLKEFKARKKNEKEGR